MHCSPPSFSVYGILQAATWQEYWSGLPFLTLGHLPNPGIEPESFESPALADGLLTIVPTGTLTQT